MRKFLFFALVSSILLGGCTYDDDALWDKVNDHEGRIESLETKVQQINNEISAMSAIVNSVQQRVSITAIDEVTAGFKVTFSNNKTYSIVNGTNGTNGTSPIVSLKLDAGVYYWTIDGNWLLKDGTTSATAPATDRVSAMGTEGQPGQAGQPGETPKIGVDASGYWTVTVGGMTSQILDAANQPVKALGTPGAQGPQGPAGNADSFFKSVDTQTKPGYVIFTLMDDTVFEVPAGEFLTFTNAPDCLFEIANGATSELTFTKTAGIVRVGISSMIPSGWSAMVNNLTNTISITAPTVGGTFDLLVTGTTNKGTSASYWVTVSSYSNDLQTLIDATPAGGTLTLDKPAYINIGGVTINKSINITSTANSQITITEPVARTTGIPFLSDRTDGGSPGILITGGVTVTLQNVRLSSTGNNSTYGLADGITMVGGTLNLINVTIDKVGDNQLPFVVWGAVNGRGVTVYRGGILHATNSTFTNINKNGIHVCSGTAYISGCTFTGSGVPNRGTQNGAVFMHGTTGSVTNSSFSNFKYRAVGSQDDDAVGVYAVDETVAITDLGGNTYSNNDIDWKNHLQSIINATPANGTLNLYKASYDETGGVVIDKNITITTSAASHIVVRNPIERVAPEIPFGTGRTDGRSPGILIKGGVTVSMAGVKLSCYGPSEHVPADGITLVGGTLNLNNVTIDGVGGWNTVTNALAFTGDQHGRGVTVYNTGTLNATNSTFSRINKNCIHIMNGTATITGCSFAGYNMAGIIAQNGVVFMGSTRGTVTGSTFTGFRYDGNNAVGLYPVDITVDLTQTGNTFTNNDIDVNPVL